jgi:acetoin utilization deacetylase AcuC-like enzyme
MKCSVITGEVFAGHDMEAHAESEERLVTALSGVPPGVTRLRPVMATPEDLERVHKRQHVRLIRELSRGLRYIDLNTYVTPQSFEVALYAAGSTIAAAERALDGEACFALVRPPGHHAEPDQAMGFCLFNNAGVAAAHLLAHGEARRVAIVDWDLHHGNGTQKIFYQDDRVFFCSIHECGIFPRTGWIDEIGEGKGKGYTLNAPLRGGGTIGDYALIFEEVFVPVLRGFDPDVIIVSAGQDPLADDPRSNMKLAPPDFGLLTRLLMEASEQPLALVLEGGYGPSLGDAVGHIIAALGGKEYRRTPEQARPSSHHLVERLKKVALY